MEHVFKRTRNLQMRLYGNLVINPILISDYTVVLQNLDWQMFFVPRSNYPKTVIYPAKLPGG